MSEGETTTVRIGNLKVVVPAYKSQEQTEIIAKKISDDLLKLEKAGRVDTVGHALALAFTYAVEAERERESAEAEVRNLSRGLIGIVDALRELLDKEARRQGELQDAAPDDDDGGDDDGPSPIIPFRA